MTNTHVNTLIIGAGLSGIGAACHLERECPGKTYAIIERRERVGGTWDLFRYPGIRSDSDMFTLGYNFRPWTQTKMLADGPSIRKYIEETAKEYDVIDNIRFGSKMIRADWNENKSHWSVTILHEKTGEEEKITCDFLLSCTGYYNYDKGYVPALPGIDNFTGDVIHPQHWPENYDYAGKRVVVIGSGATAVTLVPAMTDKAQHVTMLQRSPTYVASVPEEDLISKNLRRLLPEMVVYRMARARNILLQRTVFNVCVDHPKAMRRVLLAAVKKQVGKDFDMRHFSPKYNPWEERMCAVPKGDLFKVLRKKKASVVTDLIEKITPTGIQLRSGKHIEADILITATGLDLQMLGGANLFVDGKKIEVRERMMYKGLMLEGVPNFALVFGYTNSSWTLKADIASEFVCRLLKYMDKHKANKVVPIDDEGCGTELNFLNLRSGYIQRANDRLPRQGKKAPWQNLNNYLRDLPALRHGSLKDNVLRFFADGRQIDVMDRSETSMLRTLLPT